MAEAKKRKPGKRAAGKPAKKSRGGNVKRGVDVVVDADGIRSISGPGGTPCGKVSPSERDARVLALIDEALSLEEDLASFRDAVLGLKEDLKGAKDRLAAKQEERRKLIDQAMALRAGKAYQDEMFFSPDADPQPGAAVLHDQEGGE